MRSERRRPLIAPMLLPLAYAVLGVLGSYIVSPLYHTELLWLPEGIALGAAILYGRRTAIGIIPAGAVLAMWLGLSPVPAILVGLGSMVGVLVGTATVPIDWRERPGLRELKDVIILWRAAGVAAITTGVLVTIVGVLSGRIGTAWLGYLGEFVLADLVGAVLALPAVLAVLGPRDRTERAGTVVEFVLVIVFLVTSAFLAYVVDLPVVVGAVIPYLMGPVLLLLVLRFSWRETVAALLFMAPVAFGSAGKGAGPFAYGDVTESRLVLQIAFIGASLMAHVIVVLMDERRRMIRELQAHSDELEERVRARTAELEVLNQALLSEMGERRRVEVELRNHRADLERTVSERTASLEAVNSQLTTAMRAKAQFLANVSHELRTPLNSIIGFSDVLLGGLAGDLNEEQWRQVSIVNSSGRHLLALVNDVLDLTKIEADATRLDLENVHVAPVLFQVVETLAPIAAEKGLTLEWSAPDDARVCTDVIKLRQIMLNLVGNALKFTREGSIAVTGERMGAHVHIRVTDTGVGIHPEELSDVFSDFHQSRSPETGKPTGTGLGLAISRRLARMLGGELTAESALGRGSTFTLTLPVTCAENRIAAGGMPAR